MKMKEIEVKARISNISVIKSTFEQMGCIFSDPIIQRDKIFLRNNFSKSDCALRIRKENDRILFTMKIAQSNELDNIEKELEISDAKEMEDIIKLIGYKEFVRVNKTRIKCKYNKYEICLDDVECLGAFIEVEKILEEPLPGESISSQDAEIVQKELFDFLLEFGVKKEDRIWIGYDTMMYHKLNSVTSG